MRLRLAVTLYSNRLHVVGMIGPPCTSYSTGIDVVRNDVVIVLKLSVAESAHAILASDLSIHKFSYLGV